MKKKIFVIIAVLCVVCLLIATLVSIQRASTSQNSPKPPAQTESELETEVATEATTEVTTEATTESATEAETEIKNEETTEQERNDIGGIAFVPYTGNAYPGTAIAYRGSGENAQYVIVIDAGHQARGMSDTEPIGPGADEQKAKVTAGTQGSLTGLAEHELNLRVALALRDVLVTEGYTVVMVRETAEVEISNAERAQLANRVGAHVNIRIHANGDANTAIKGAMTVCQTPSNPYNAGIYEECRALSDAVLESFCASTGIDAFKVWETDTMTGTNWASVPTTIIEMGFMTNAEDEAVLAANDFAAKAAEGLAKGIAAYLQANAPIEQPTETESSTQEPTTKPEQGTYPVSKYDINFQREAELGQTFTEVETTVEFTGTAWVRTEPSTQGGDATKMMNIKTYAGKRVTCIGLGENWHRVLIDGKVYYVSAAYLKVVEE
jgi:N-acetylmuramoyl-L-alanine amidase